MVFKEILRKYRTHLLALLLGISLIYSLPNIAVLAHGGDTTLIHGCVLPITGLLRIIKANDKCTKKEKSLDWSVGGSAATGGGGIFAFKGAGDITPTCSSPVGSGSCAAESQIPLPLQEHSSIA